MHFFNACVSYRYNFGYHIFFTLQISHIIREIRQFQQTAYKIDYQAKGIETDVGLYWQNIGFHDQQLLVKFVVARFALFCSVHNYILI